MSNRFKKLILGLFIAVVLLSIWKYHKGYGNAINWEVTTTAETIEFPAWELDNGLIKHQINGEMYLLQEKYSGSKISRNLLEDQVYLGMIWLGLCIFLALSTAFNRYFFFVIIAAMALLINRLNLYEVGLFGISHKMVMIIPFVLFSAPLLYFHEFNKTVSFPIRLLVLIVISVGFCLGIENTVTFTNHFLAHSLFSFILIGLIFLILISEEIIFSLLYVVSSSRGGKSNHLHLIILSVSYLGNLILYYLNKSGIYENSFFFFDPFILLIISTSIAVWSLNFKNELVKELIPHSSLVLVLSSLGIITFSFINLSIMKGLDSVYQAFYYFVVYFHIGFGVFFFFYIIANFLDPLIKGFEVYKIVYRERNFPYVTARLGGLVVVAAFYFLSGQEPYNLLRSGYYSLLSEKEEALGNKLLSQEYLSHAEFLGFNTHYPNYKLAWKEWEKGKKFSSKSHFFNAAQRYPSPYALVNYGNIEAEINPNKVQANYEESLRRSKSSEIMNNLGIIHVQKGEIEKALAYFDLNEPTDPWNDAPLINKWNTLNKIGSYDSASALYEYQNGSFGSKANILITIEDTEDYEFINSELEEAGSLHRQAYLLNSSFIFKHDSIKSHIQRELLVSTSAATNRKLSKALALHLYKKGEVNQAFILLDDLQANASRVHKGEYLDALGKLSLDQKAFKLAADYFTEAIKEGFESSRLSRIEAYASLNAREKVTNELLKVVENDPGLTDFANELLDKLTGYKVQQSRTESHKPDTMNTQSLVEKTQKNAFNVDFIVPAVEALNKRDTLSGYHILVEAIEINPYSVDLLKSYILTALQWNLNDYAEQSLSKLKGLVDEADFQAFMTEYNLRKSELANEEW